MKNLDRLFQPRSVAIIGASRKRGKIGNDIINNMLSAGFTGRLYPVNPVAREVAGLRCWPSVRNIKGPVDVALIAIPAGNVPPILEDCGKKKIPFVVVISSGFKEVGDKGAELEKRLQTIARRHRITLLGPNCLGYLNVAARVNASFAAGRPSAGRASFISQSGALLVGLLDWGLEHHVGLNKLISVGNKAGLSELEIIEYLDRDNSTSVIGLYLEQIERPAEFMAIVSRVSRRKPVIVLKAGVSVAGQRAVSSHSGSLASSPRVISALLRQCGAIEVASVEELFNLMRYFAVNRQASGSNVAVISNAGGPSIIAVDALVAAGLPMASLSVRTQERLKRFLPSASSVKNPVDIMGDADLKRFSQSLKITLADPGVNHVLLIATPQSMTPVIPLAKAIVRAQARASKDIMVCFIGGRKMRQARLILSKAGVQHFSFPNDAVKTLALGQTHFRPHELYPRSLKPTTQQTKATPAAYHYVSNLCRRYRLPLVHGITISKPADIKKIIKFPVAMKILSTKVIHKKLAGGVALNVQDSHEARKVYSQMRQRFGKYPVEGILVQPMAATGLEMLLGVKRDPSIGPVIICGLGGSMAEAMNDVVMRIAPISRKDAHAMLTELRNAKLLQGHDRAFVISLLLRLSVLAMSEDQVAELDLNPVAVYAKGGKIIDARVLRYS